MSFDRSKIVEELQISGKKYRIYSLLNLSKQGLGDVSRLPFSIRILLESAIRNYDDYQVTLDDIKTLSGWTPKGELMIATAWPQRQRPSWKRRTRPIGRWPPS